MLVAVALAVTLEEEKLAARLSVTGIPVGADTLTIERKSPSGNVAGVRGAVDATVTGTSYLIRDYELPLDTTVTYTVSCYDGTTNVGSASAIFSISYGQCEAWLTDLARPTNSLQVTVESLAALAHPVPSGVHRVLDRRAPVVTALVAWTPATELIVLTETLDERDAVRALFGSGYPVLVRTSPAQGIGNIYLAASEFVEERFLTLGAAPERRFRVACVQVERPDPSIYVPLAPNTYANAKATYATYADLKAGVVSYDELAYTYPTGTTNPILPWLPDDV
jgi:hypothetical protein